MLKGIKARDVTVGHVYVTNVQGISESQHERLAEELGVTRSALTSFFKILAQQQVSPEDLDHTLRQIAGSYKELQAKLQSFTSDDPAVLSLKQQAQGNLNTGDFAQAEALLNDASQKDLEMAQQFQEAATKRLLSAAASKAENGDLKMTQLAYAEAIAYYRQATALVESIPRAEAEILATYLNSWGLASWQLGDYFEAEPPLQRALAIREQFLGGAHPDVAQGLNNLAVLYDAQGRHAEAEPLYQRALAIYEQTLGAEHPEVATSLNNLAELYDTQSRYAEAEPLYRRALAIREQALGSDHPDVAQTLNNLLVRS